VPICAKNERFYQCRRVDGTKYSTLLPNSFTYLLASISKNFLGDYDYDDDTFDLFMPFCYATLTSRLKTEIVERTFLEGISFLQKVSVTN
jgi:hypothetical protein